MDFITWPFFAISLSSLSYLLRALALGLKGSRITCFYGCMHFFRRRLEMNICIFPSVLQVPVLALFLVGYGVGVSLYG